MGLLALAMASGLGSSLHCLVAIGSRVEGLGFGVSGCGFRVRVPWFNV